MVRVEDVSDFPGHIACDAESKSEIVVPVVKGDEVGFLGLAAAQLSCLVALLRV